MTEVAGRAWCAPGDLGLLQTTRSISMFWWKTFLRRWLPEYSIDVDEEDDVLEYDEHGNPVQMPAGKRIPSWARRRQVDVRVWRVRMARRAREDQRVLGRRLPRAPLRALAASQPRRVSHAARVTGDANASISDGGPRSTSTHFASREDARHAAVHEIDRAGAVAPAEVPS